MIGSELEIDSGRVRPLRLSSVHKACTISAASEGHLLAVVVSEVVCFLAEGQSMVLLRQMTLFQLRGGWLVRGDCILKSASL